MIVIDHLFFQYTPGIDALKDISVEFPDSTSISAIIGESGSGKTTLLRCIGRFLEPSTGTISINGTNITTFEEKAFRRMLGIVFQKLYLFPHLSVMGNLILALEKVTGLKRHDAEERAQLVLERLGIQELANSYPVQLSGGQAQRAAIARALVLEPQYLLLDEPTSALDINTTRDFGNWLLHLQEKTKFIIVTHDIDFVKNVAADGMLLEQGEMKINGTINDIITNFLHPTV